jgi:hypothetical protein
MITTSIFELTSSASGVSCPVLLGHKLDGGWTARVLGWTEVWAEGAIGGWRGRNAQSTRFCPGARVAPRRLECQGLMELVGIELVGFSRVIKVQRLGAGNSRLLVYFL